MYEYDVGGRLVFYPASEEDGFRVSRWRNSDDARKMFYNQEVVTPDTHIMFMQNRAPHDLIWIIWVKEFNVTIGMTSLTINTRDYTAEYGRAFIDPLYRGKGYGLEQEYMVLSLAFEVFNLQSLWGDVLIFNAAALGLHHKAGWLDAGLNMPGHTSERGSVMHIVYTRDTWDNVHRQNFIDLFRIRL